MDEISLKEILVILLKDKKWILLTTLLFLCAALVYGLTAQKVYVAEAVLKVSPININPKISNDESLIGDITAIAQFSVMDINSYAQQLVNTPVLEGTIRALESMDKNEESIQVEALKHRITINADEKTNIIHVIVKDTTPQSAADLANMLGEQLTLYLTDTISQNCVETAKNIRRQLESQKEKIDATAAQLKVYTEGAESAPELESATKSLITQMAQYRSDLNDIERRLQSDSLALAGIQNAGVGASAGSFKINISSSRAGTRYASANNEETVLSGNGVSPVEIMVESGSDVENIIIAVKKAELEMRLVQNEAEYNALQDSLAEMESELSRMTVVLAEEKQQYDILQRDYRVAGDIYGQYQKIYQQIPLIASSDLARKNIQVLSPGIPASRPENKNALFYAAVGGVLGLLTGMFAVLFKNYWRQA